MRQKNAARRRKYWLAVVSNRAIKHFDFQKLARLWLAGEVVNHVGIYGPNVAEAFLCSNVGLVTSVLEIKMVSTPTKHLMICRNESSLSPNNYI